VRNSVRCAWGKFHELAAMLTRRGVSLKLKRKFYRACVQSVLLYGSETWPTKVEDDNQLERAERAMARSMCGVSLRDRISMEDIMLRLGVEEVLNVVRTGRLRWFGHVERKCGWVSTCRNIKVL